MPYYPFDSRNLLYKSVYGAVASEQSLRLRLLLHRDARVHDAFLHFRKDGEAENSLPLTPGDWLEDYRFYETELCLPEGLYWYDFSYTSDYGTFRVTKTEHSLGIVSSEGTAWQLTVYEKEFQTPQSFAGGLIYQIFPDRFARVGQKDCPYRDRLMQENWFAQPQYRQDDPVDRLGNDYYGGNLPGIIQKIPYLKSLGVTVLYLNPIFEAHSNHRYNTADYLKIDPLLGTEQDFRELCRCAQEAGISVILDGVFSHTGDDSRYFNRKNRYRDEGAFQSRESVYYPWYSFEHWPDRYASWWGIDTLPETNENNPDFDRFITGENGVLRHWMRLGAKGWRLDVADELPDEFLDHIRTAVKAEDPQAMILGEVWEDATNKISHGGRRRFLRGRQLDSVMNYPFSEAIIAYLNGGNSRDLIDSVLDITENYPPQTVHLLMNHIGTHDTARILSRLGRPEPYPHDRGWQASQQLSEEEYAHAVRFLQLAAVLQYTLPGIPSLYYGDEAGMQGYDDPFCRAAYPWGHEDEELLNFYRLLGRMRSENSCFKNGEFLPVYANMGHLVYIRKNDENEVLIGVNRWCDAETAEVPERFENAVVLHGNPVQNGKLTVNREDYCLLVRKSAE